MCGRYTYEHVQELKERYDAYNNPLPTLEPSYNVTPGTINPVIARLSPNGIYMMWGLVPFWAKDPKIGYSTINARAEEITAKPAFRKPIKSQRCLIPCSGFYEWKKLTLEKKEEKFPWYIKVKGKDIFSLAGIYDIWRDVEKKEFYSYSIITTTPNKMMAEIHNRMPVILNEKDEDKYLNPDSPLEEVLKLLKPYLESEMEAYPVSTRVNNPMNDDEKLIEKV